MIEMIAAVSPSGGIGYKGELLYKNKRDMRIFKEKTEHGTVVMGRLTWDSLPTKPLRNRLNIVITRDPLLLYSRDSMGSVVFLESISSTIQYLSGKEASGIFIIGGAQIYKEFMGIADRITLHRFPEERAADTFFPTIVGYDKLSTIESSVGFSIETYVRGGI